MLNRSILLAGLTVCFGSATAVRGQSVIEPGAKLIKLVDGFAFTEGPAADADGNIYFTDQPNNKILRWSTLGELSEFLTPCGRSNGLYFAPNGQLLACADEQNELWSIDPSGKHQVLFSRFDDKRLNGPNDLWVHTDGTVYFTDPYYPRPYWQRGPEEQTSRGLYRFRKGDSQPERLDGDFRQPNGIIGDSRRSLLYVADIGDKKTWLYRIDEQGDLHDRQLFCEQGSDGMTIDNEGNVYLTGAGVTVYSAEGQRLEQIPVPEKWTANVTFGGPKRQTLFITASQGLYSLNLRTNGI